MKKQIIICIALMFAAAGCSKEKPDGAGELRKVELSVAVPDGYLSPVTRAYIPGCIDGWYNTEIYLASYKEDVANGVPVFQGTYGRILRGLVDKTTTMFDPLLFYPVSGNERVHLRGFYPRRNCSDIPEGFKGTDYDISPKNNKLRYNLTGKEDLMISNCVSGSMEDPLSGQGIAGQLHFQHLLTKLSFKLKAVTNSFPKTLAVKTIRIWGVHKQPVMNVDGANADMDAVLVWADDGTDVSGNSFVAYNNDKGLEITNYETAELGQIMLRPGEKFSIEIEFINGYKAKVENIKAQSGSGEDISAGGTARATGYIINIAFNSENSYPVVDAKWSDVEVKDPSGENWW